METWCSRVLRRPWELLPFISLLLSPSMSIEVSLGTTLNRYSSFSPVTLSFLLMNLLFFWISYCYLFKIACIFCSFGIWASEYFYCVFVMFSWIRNETSFLINCMCQLNNTRVQHLLFGIYFGWMSLPSRDLVSKSTRLCLFGEN